MVFESRSKGHEEKHRLDQETEFRAVARRNRLAGLWAAGLLGKSGQAAEEYAKEIVHADFAEAGDEDVVRRLAQDLAGHMPAEEIRSKLASLLREARAQIAAERG